MLCRRRRGRRRRPPVARRRDVQVSSGPGVSGNGNGLGSDTSPATGCIDCRYRSTEKSFRWMHRRAEPATETIATVQ